MSPRYKGLTGLGLILWGVALMVGGIVAGVSWVAFCFGSIVIGVLLLLFAPHLLLLPFVLSKLGLRHFSLGVDLLTRPERY